MSQPNGAYCKDRDIKRSIMELLIILLIPLILAIVYNFGSPNSIPIIPKKASIQTSSGAAAPQHAHRDRDDEYR